MTPNVTDAARSRFERMYPGSVSILERTDPEFMERFHNFAFDEALHDAEGNALLDERRSALSVLAALVGCQGDLAYRVILAGFLTAGVVTPSEVKEVVYQASAYVGVGRMLPFLKETNDVLEARGVELPLPDQAMVEPAYEPRAAAGEQVQIEAFGEGMRGFAEAGDPAYPQINRWLSANCFGDWYTRGALELADRELVTFCLLAAQGGCEPQLESHIGANVRLGNDRRTLLAAASVCVPYVGYPRVLNAIAAVERACADGEGDRG